jgi:dTDP-glucose pyrophosphorylase
LQLAYDAGIRDIGIVCNIHNQSEMETCIGYLFEDAVLSYWPQDAAYMMFCNKVSHEEINATARHTNINGQVGALMCAENFLKGEGCLVLYADNVNLDPNLPKLIQQNLNNEGNTIFVYPSIETASVGTVVVEKGEILGLYEKDISRRSNLVISGVHLFSGEDFMKFSKYVKHSERGELEMTSLNTIYWAAGKLKIGGKISSVFDIGTFEGLYHAAQAVRNIRWLDRKGIMT